MEHDVNSLIRNKVKHAEGQPVSWNKDRVWEMVNVRSAPASSYKFIYYAAALITIALGVAFYEVHTSHQKDLAVKIASLENAINKTIQPNEVQEKTTICLPDSPQVLMSSLSNDHVLHFRENNKINRVPVLQEEEINPVGIVIANAPPEQISIMAQEEVIQPDRQVQAIIGTFPEPTQEVVKLKVRKPKFQLFRSHEREVNEFLGSESELLSARIN